MIKKTKIFNKESNEILLLSNAVIIEDFGNTVLIEYEISEEEAKEEYNKEQKEIEQWKFDMSRIYELEKWFIYYDNQTMQFNRSLRLNELFDKDINILDAQAKQNSNELKNLRKKYDIK